MTTTAIPGQPTEAATSSAAASPGIEDIVARAIPAVAAIQAGPSRGTGFFVRRDTVVTNAHVVGSHASVQLQVGSARHAARVIAASTATDIAVLHVPGAGVSQPTLPLGESGSVRVGQEVIAIGSALGVLSNTVTRGIVSGIRSAGNVTLIQTDAAINPGNSGGPLIDRGGRVIGINTMKAFAGAESIGFAVAIAHASALLDGRPAPGASTTPAAGLENMLQRGESPAPDTAGDARARGEQAYDAAVANAARRAAALDEHWDRYARECVVASSNAGDRRWMAALDTNGVRVAASNTRISCGQWLATVAEHAREIDATIREANEAARRAGVYPGYIREARRRQRLDSPRWN